MLPNIVLTASAWDDVNVLSALPLSIKRFIYSKDLSFNFPGALREASTCERFTRVLYPPVTSLIVDLSRPAVLPSLFIDLTTASNDSLPVFLINGVAIACTAFAPNFIGAPATNPANPPTAPAYLAIGSSKSRNFSSSASKPGTPNPAVSKALHNPTPNALSAPPLTLESSSKSPVDHGNCCS